MQATLTTHLFAWLAIPEHLFVAVFALAAALTLFSLAVEAGTYPEVERGFRKLGKALGRLRSALRPRHGLRGQGHVTGR